MKVVMVEPGKPAYTTEIGSDLESMQKAVGGLIEIMQIDRKVNIVLNEEGKLIGLEGNRRVGNHIIVGNFFICGEKGEDFCSLTDEQCEKYCAQFAQPHEITQDEIEDDTYAFVISF
ncbi:MAG: DUF3846 domain-containing protein [Ruminiclostridium sp.]|nr:DUF3846 domain-containing protein [Ruminiclostridium sp.]